MTDIDPLVERLNNGVVFHDTGDSGVAVIDEGATDALLAEAADRIQSDAKIIEELRVALKPFADCAADWISDDEDDEEWAKFRLLIKDYRRARAALEPKKEQNDG